jgi:hypothetical protein
MQKKRNIILLSALLATLSLIAILELASNDGNGLDIDKRFYQLNPNQEITDVYLNSANESNHFKYLDGRWLLNDSLFLDQSMRDVFFSVISQLEIRRPVGSQESDSIAAYLKDEGTYAKITFGEEIIKEYWIGGNKNEQISWIMGADMVPYQVHIPGYQSYIAGIFAVPAKDWRSRFILNLNFALIQKINLRYPTSSKNLELVFKDNFFEIPDFNADSSKVANFLDQLAYLQADQFLEASDTVSSYAGPMNAENIYATLNFTLLSGDSTKINFYEAPDDRFMIAQLDDLSLALINKRRIADLFKTRDDFD